MKNINELIKMADSADEYEGPIGKEPQPPSKPIAQPIKQPSQTTSLQSKPTTKSTPVSTDVKSKIIELQQAILDFKNVAQSTDFGSYGTTVQDQFARTKDETYIQGYKAVNDFFLDKYMAPVSDKAKVWKQKPGSVAEQYVQVEMPTAQRGMKGSGAVAPIDFKGIIETIGRIRNS